MKKLLLATAMATTFVSSAIAQDLNSLNKELEIMSGVIGTALKQETGKKGIRYSGIEATYLAKQGVVFTVSTSSNKWNFNFDRIFSSVPHAPDAPNAPIVITTDDMDMDIDIDMDQDFEGIAEDALAHVEHIFVQKSDEMRELRSRKRELAWEQREMERRQRDLEFEMRAAQDEREEEIKEELKTLEKERKEFEKQREKIELHAAKLTAEQEAKAKERKEKREQALKTFLANFEGAVGDTLCRFGSGLRELPDSENISFVLKGFAKGDGSDKSDRIYVFSKQEVKKCVMEKINASSLLSKANIYEF